MPGEANEVNWRGVRPVSGIRGVWPARNAVRLSAVKRAMGDQTLVIYEVPGGKILFISGSLIAITLSLDAESRGYTFVRDAGEVTQYYIDFMEFTKAGQMFGSMYHLPALEVEAGWEVCVLSGHANMNCRGVIHGWLEDA